MKYGILFNERERERVKAPSKNSLTVFLGRYASLFSVAIFLFVSTSIAHAAPLYTPGQTLDPTCLPTNPDCTVASYAASGINSDITQLSALTAATSTNLIVTNLFTALTGWFTNLIAQNSTTTNATTTNLFASNLQIGSTNGLLFGTNGVVGTISTSSLGITSSWGNVTGTLSNQTDLQNALNAKLNSSSFTSLFASTLSGTTTTALPEGNNLYFTTSRASTTAIAVLGATTSLPNITTLAGLSLPSSQVTGLGSLATLSTINNLDWLGTALSVGNGGTGQTSFTDGQILIGNSTGNTLTPATLSGTSNEISITNGHGSITLSTPQAIGTPSTPTFSGLTLTGALSVLGITNTGSITSTATSTALAFVSTSATATSTFANSLTVGTTSFPLNWAATSSLAVGGVIFSPNSPATCNVKGFGAKGDNTTDDTNAIQNAVDYCFGTSANYHGSGNATSNHELYFPPGHYKITSPIKFTGLEGAKVYGAGRFTTLITNYTSTTTSNAGDVFDINGAGYSYFGEMALQGGASSTDMDLNWDGIVNASTQSDTIEDMFFNGGDVGVNVGADGYQASEILFLNDHFSNHHYGLEISNYNALQITVIGGNFSTNYEGIHLDAGSVNVYSTGFQGSTNYDINLINSAHDTTTLSGIRSESTNFLNSTYRNLVIENVTQTSGNSGVFVNSGGGYFTIQGSNTVNGQIGGHPFGTIDSSSFGRNDWLAGNESYISMTNSTIGATNTSTQTNIIKQYFGNPASYRVASTTSDSLTVMQSKLPTNLPQNTISILAPTSVPTSYQWILPSSDAPGFLMSDGLGTPGHLSILATTSLGTASSTAFTANTLFSTSICLSSDCRTSWPVAGSSGGGTWSTSTSQVGGEMINYSNSNTDIVSIGGNATSTAKFFFDPTAQFGYFSGKIGIGTTSPSSRLSIQDNSGLAGTNPLFTIASSSATGTGTSTLFTVLGNGSVNFPMSTATTTIAGGLNVAGSSGLTVLQNGMVGVGNNNPSQRLDIQSGAIRFSFLSAPSAPSAVLAGLGAGNLANGTYYYKVSFVNALGESLESASSSPVTVADNTTNGQVTVTLPVSSESSVIKRYLYRTGDGGVTWCRFNVGTINNNTTTTFTDNTASPSGGCGYNATIATDSGTIFVGNTTAMSIDSSGAITNLSSLSVNGGRATDNDGTLGFGLGIKSTNKSGLFVADNFGQSSSGAYIAAMNTDTTNHASASAFFGNKSTTYNASLSGLGAVAEFDSGNAAGSYNSIGTKVRISTINVANTASSFGYVSHNYLQGSGGLNNYYGYYSYGQYATSGTNLTNQYDFYADNFQSPTAGTTTNRYGLYLGFNNVTGVGTTNAYGVYQTSPTVKNFFGGNVGIGTTSPSANLSIQNDSGSTNTTLFSVASSTVSNNSSASTLFSISNTGVFTASTTNASAATSTINGNLYVNGALRSTTSYNGDLFFANNFSFTEAPLDGTPQGLLLKNQNSQTILYIDENGNLTTTGDICTNTTNCLGTFNTSLSSLSNRVNALASTTTTTPTDWASAITTLNQRIDALSSTTASVASTTTALLQLNQVSTSTIASTTATALSSSTSFIQMIANAVLDLVQTSGQIVNSAATWTVNEIHAGLAVFTDVKTSTIETQTASVTNGIEMTSPNGQVWCVRAGDTGALQQTLGSCTTATSTVSEASNPKLQVLDNNQATNTDDQNGTSTSTTSTTTIATTTSVIATSTSTTSAPVVIAPSTNTTASSSIDIASSTVPVLPTIVQASTTDPIVASTTPTTSTSSITLPTDPATSTPTTVIPPAPEPTPPVSVPTPAVPDSSSFTVAASTTSQ